VTALCRVACTLDAALDMHTHTLDTKSCYWTCLDMLLDNPVTIVVV
jgi:hypothetical protein